MTIHFDPRAAELKRRAATRAMFEAAKPRFGRRRPHRPVSLFPLVAASVFILTAIVAAAVI